MDTLKATERTKAILDALDLGLSRHAVAQGLGLTRNTVVGECHRHGLAMGKSIVLDLARKFPEASVDEIAEATGRDGAAHIMADASVYRRDRAYSRKRVAAMRAILMREAA